MTDIPIPSLPSATLPLAGSEIFVAQQGGTTVQLPGSAIIGLAQGNLFATKAAVVASLVAHLFSYVLVAGYAAAGDCGVALLLIPTTQSTSNPGVWQSADGQKWLIANATVNPAMFGGKFDGTTDDTAAFNACCTFADNNGRNVDVPFKLTRIDGNITSWNPQTTDFNGLGVFFDCTHRAVNSGYVFNSSATETFGAGSHPLRGIHAIGPGVGHAGVKFLNVTHNSMKMNDCVITDFATVISLPDTSFFAATNCGFGRSFNDTVYGGIAGYVIETTGDLSQNCENMSFLKCASTNRGKFVITTNSTELMFDTCSIDGGASDSARFVTNGFSGSMRWTNCHFEHDFLMDTDYLYYQTSDSASMVFVGTSFQITGPRLTYSPFYSNMTDSFGGGLYFDNGCRVSYFSNISDNTAQQPFVTGGGVVKAPGGIQKSPSYDCYVLSPSLNTLAYGDFESANYTADWSTIDTGWVRDTAAPHEGTYCMKYAFPTGFVLASMVHKVPIQEGMRLCFTMFYKFTGVAGTGAGCGVTLTFQDAGGNSIGDARYFDFPTGADSPWTSLAGGGLPPPPAGSKYAIFQITAHGGSVTGTPIAYVDMIIVNKCA